MPKVRRSSSSASIAIATNRIWLRKETASKSEAVSLFLGCDEARWQRRLTHAGAERHKSEERPLLELHAGERCTCLPRHPRPLGLRRWLWLRFRDLHSRLVGLGRNGWQRLRHGYGLGEGLLDFPRALNPKFQGCFGSLRLRCGHHYTREPNADSADKRRRRGGVNRERARCAFGIRHLLFPCHLHDITRRFVHSSPVDGNKGGQSEKPNVLL
ncbi:MAG: hypothetical protein QOF09_509 [Alphaproteobacteria bacterium]|nr:hypothetical protein [Alphaproteobacteria bacterium]